MSDPGTTQPSTAPPPAAWRDGITDEALRNDPFVTTAPDLTTFAKNAIATKAMTGRKAYDLPQPDWKPEQWKAWNTTIGVPDAPDKYSPVDRAALEKAGLPPEVISTAAAKFHEMGLTDRQAKGLLDWYVGDAGKGREMQAEQSAAARVAGEAELRKEFGDKLPAKMGLLKAWLSKNGSPEFAAAIDKAGLGNDPAFVKAILKSAEATMEDSSRTGSAGHLPGTESASALMEVEQMKGRRLIDRAYSEKFNDPKSPERIRWDQLHQIAFQTTHAA